MSKLLLFLHLRLRLCHRLRLCFTAFISQIRLHLLKMKRSSSNKELLFLFNSDFSDAEAAQGALEITSIRGDVGGFLTIPTPTVVEAGRGVSNSVEVGAQPYCIICSTEKLTKC